MVLRKALKRRKQMQQQTLCKNSPNLVFTFLRYYILYIQALNRNLQRNLAFLKALKIIKNTPENSENSGLQKDIV